MKELEDHPLFPSLFRNFQTDFIGFVVTQFNSYKAFVEYLGDLELPVQSMKDLCSGSGEPALSIFMQSNCFDDLSLSDKFPRTLKLRKRNIPYSVQRSDVLEMDYEQGKCYTMFNAFHHFNDADKLKIVKKIEASGSTAFILEILEPNLLCLLKVLLITTVGTVVLTPFVRPFSFSRLFFTYIIPVNILTITFDGIVSVFKSGSAAAYRKLFAADDSIEVKELSSSFHPLILIQIHSAK